jgi:hypothetical protein
MRVRRRPGAGDLPWCRSRTSIDYMPEDCLSIFQTKRERHLDFLRDDVKAIR